MELKRLYFIDAIRAFAILMMLQGHFIDTLLAIEYRDANNLAFSTWMVSFYWLHQQIFHGEKPEKSNVEGEMKIWSMLLPHLTEKGIKSFRKFFGDDYLKKMGKSFNSDLEKYVGF